MTLAEEISALLAMQNVETLRAADRIHQEYAVLIDEAVAKHQAKLSSAEAKTDPTTPVTTGSRYTMWLERVPFGMAPVADGGAD
jgi:hypothetical protein